MFGSLLLAGCSTASGPLVELIVPKGFTGTIWLLLEPGGKDIPMIDGRYQVVVPPDGVLRVRSHGPLEHWHSFSARFDNNITIPYDLRGDAGIGPEVIAVRKSWAGVTSRAGHEYRYVNYFVGTAKQLSDLPDIPDIPGTVK
jgi:hypothetical protein